LVVWLRLVVRLRLAALLLVLALGLLRGWRRRVAVAAQLGDDHRAQRAHEHQLPDDQPLRHLHLRLPADIGAPRPRVEAQRVSNHGAALLARSEGPKAPGRSSARVWRRVPPSEPHTTTIFGPNSKATCRHAPHGAVTPVVGVKTARAARSRCPSDTAFQMARRSA